MTRTALILGPNGRFGRHITDALTRHGWTVRTFDRKGAESVADAAMGCALIVNCWNPPYPDWAAMVPGQKRTIIDAAKASGAAVLIPGNVYVYGDRMPPVIGPGVPHAATNTLGRIRIELEASYRASGVKTVILRGGDFLDDGPSGNWFDRVITAKADRGVLTYPGPMDRPHAWAYLPDMTEAAARLVDDLDALPRYSDLAFEGYTLTGKELTDTIAEVAGRPMKVRRMSWLPIRLARPVWAMGRHLVEMSYLWRVPHRLDGSALRDLLPDMQAAPLQVALSAALKR